MNGKKEEFIKLLDKALDLTKDYDKMINLFSDDECKRGLAQLNQTVGKIKYAIELANIKEVGHPKNKAIMDSAKCGVLVKIKPCSKLYNDKTFLGVYIGNIALGSVVYIENEKIKCSWAHYNPGILVPDIGKVIYGAESWWSEIKSEDDLKEITNKDIENVWYVKALKQIEES